MPGGVRNRVDRLAPMSEVAAPEPVSHDIDVSKRGVTIDGTLLESSSISALTTLLGAPRIVDPPSAGPEERGGPRNTRFYWDAAGVWAYSKDRETASEIDVMLQRSEDPSKREREPRGVLSGTFTVNGAPAIRSAREKELRRGRFLLEVRTGDWRLMLFLSDAAQKPYKELTSPERWEAEDSGWIRNHLLTHESPVGSATIVYDPVRKPSGRWKHQPYSGDTLEFTSRTFQYAVIQELMYGQQLLTPKFDVHDFAADQGPRSFDPGESNGRIIASVRTWFQKLPIPAELAQRVESLYLDGGNEIYLQLAPLWDGEDDQFRIRSLSDDELAQFPHLTKVQDIGGFLSPTARKTLQARGIEVED